MKLGHLKVRQKYNLRCPGGFRTSRPQIKGRAQVRGRKWESRSAASAAAAEAFKSPEGISTIPHRGSATIISRLSGWVSVSLIPAPVMYTDLNHCSEPEKCPRCSIHHLNWESYLLSKSKRTKTSEGRRRRLKHYVRWPSGLRRVVCPLCKEHLFIGDRY